MTLHLGDVPANSTLYIPFATYGGANGESITLTGLAATDIEIYKNGSVTQRASDAGYTLLDTDGIDFDSITGIHGFSIDLADNTDAGFYSVGGFYWVVVSAVTVDSQTVNFIAATFRIVPAESLAGHPKVDVGGWLGTAPATPTVAGVPEVDVTHVGGSAASTVAGAVDANVVAIGGDAQSATDLKDFADAGYDPATNKVQGVVLVDTLTTYTGNTPQTGDSFARIGATGSGLTSLAPSATALSTAQWTNARAGYLDNINNATLAGASFPTDPADQSLIIAATDALATLIGDVPTVAEFNARTLAAADYATNTDLDALIATVGVAGAGLTEAGGTGDHLTAIAWNASWDAEVQSEVTDALDAYDSPTNAELSTALAAADDAVLAAIAALNNLSAAQVNTEILDVLTVDAFTQPGQENPAATTTLAKMLAYLYKAWRNKTTQTSSEYALYADDGTTKDQEAVVSDDGTTATRGEVSTGA